MTDGKVESLSLDDEGGLIKLISKDGREFPIEKKYAFVSTLVKTSLETGQIATGRQRQHRSGVGARRGCQNRSIDCRLSHSLHSLTRLPVASAVCA